MDYNEVAVLNVIPLTEKVGAEITAIDLAGELADRTIAQVTSALGNFGVIVVRDQQLSIEQFLAFSRRIGPLTIHPLKQFSKPGFPELMVNSNIVEDGKPVGLADGGQDWHTDGAYLERPHRATILYAVEVPVKDGVAVGDTMFASTAWAYESLPQETRAKLAGLRAVHRHGVHRERRNAGVHLDESQRKGVVHPVIRTHSQTRRKCIYVNEGTTAQIEGMDQAESDATVQALVRHITRPECVYRHNWRVGDVVMWDNCSTQHCAIGDYQPPLRRLIYRTVVLGDRPE